MICNTATCTGYSADILGNGSQQHGVAEWWLKNSAGQPLGWYNFSEDSVHFAGTVWIAIRYATVFVAATEVATLRIFECNNNLIETRGLIIPVQTTWKKWTFTCSFGQTCHWALTDQSWGTGTMPDTPPP
jgi:hypothetical protein